MCTHWSLPASCEMLFIRTYPHPWIAVIYRPLRWLEAKFCGAVACHRSRSLVFDRIRPERRAATGPVIKRSPFVEIDANILEIAIGSPKP